MYKWILSPAMGSDIYPLKVDRLTANTLLAISPTFQVFFKKKTELIILRWNLNLPEKEKKGWNLSDLAREELRFNKLGKSYASRRIIVMFAIYIRTYGCGLF
jgi:hypothetical protein